MAETYKGYTLVNREKLNRVINGSEGPQGELIGGLGDEATEAAILAHYDKLGGLIRKGKSKVKTGCFWDFEGRKPFAKPKVVFVFRDLRGKKVELGENEEVPVEVQAAEKMREEEELEGGEEEEAEEEVE